MAHRTKAKHHVAADAASRSESAACPCLSKCAAPLHSCKAVLPVRGGRLASCRYFGLSRAGAVRSRSDRAPCSQTENSEYPGFPPCFARSRYSLLALAGALTRGGIEDRSIEDSSGRPLVSPL